MQAAHHVLAGPLIMYTRPSGPGRIAPANPWVAQAIAYTLRSHHRESECLPYVALVVQYGKGDIATVARMWIHQFPQEEQVKALELARSNPSAIYQP